MSDHNRIEFDEAMALYDSFDMNKLSELSIDIRKKINQRQVFYNHNFHIEPSNICIHRCKFCSFRRDSQDQDGAWDMEIEEIAKYCREKYQKGMSEAHIVGSVHPKRDLNYYCDLIECVKKNISETTTIKAFSAVEIDNISKNSGKSLKEVLTILKNSGLSALPGGGAEIFAPEIREIICPDKSDANRWLEIHKTAHEIGIRSNCTMLFGHLEKREHRIEHLLTLRRLQDETGGFDAFIPLLFKPQNNQLSHLGELNIIEILKTFAISRIVLDNINHIKSYWPMLGKDLCQLTLLYGADDIDGTINDSTKIYSMAGSSENSPYMTKEDLENLAKELGYCAVERDSFYNIL